jgi:hypothetical protein
MQSTVREGRRTPRDSPVRVSNHRRPCSASRYLFLTCSDGIIINHLMILVFESQSFSSRLAHADFLSFPGRNLVLFPVTKITTISTTTTAAAAICTAIIIARIEPEHAAIPVARQRDNIEAGVRHDYM